MTPKNEYSTGRLFLSAAECDARHAMSWSSLATHLILTATMHANRLGVGYADLIKDGNAWVLSRLSMEMERMPAINSHYEVVTWIESFNRHLSHRNFAILDGDGRPMGYARSLWACINIESRRPASLRPVEAVGDRECPIAPLPRLGAVEGDDVEVHPCRIVYSDIDFNGHVNSARWIEMLMNCRSLDWHLTHALRRLDVAFVHEAFFGTKMDVRLHESDTAIDFEIVSESADHLRARCTF